MIDDGDDGDNIDDDKDDDDGDGDNDADDNDDDDDQVLHQVLAHRPNGRVPRNGIWAQTLQQQKEENVIGIKIW